MARQESFPANAIANFPRTFWACHFAFDSLQNPDIEGYTKEIEAMNHFENEIEKQLYHISNAISHSQLEDLDDYDLHIIALIFQNLRQYGYRIYCDVFKKFKDVDGKFNKSIDDDAKGILSLYEATFLKMHGEEILDEALAFARPRLEVLAKKSNLNLSKHITKALKMPFHRGLPRLEAREYISFYEQQESHNDTLLKFAKLDFNRVQLLHLQEIDFILRWWAELNIAKSFPYARDMVVNAYFLACQVHFEPEFSVSRILLAKIAQLLVVLDDTYDSHGTLEELECLTAAFERCSFDAIDELDSDDMKLLYKTFLDYLEELEYHANKDGRCYSFHHAKEQLKEQVRSFLLETRWYCDKILPSFDAYMQNALISCQFGILTAIDFVALPTFALLKEIEWLQGNPKLLEASKVFGRLLDDMLPRKNEEKEGYCTALKCYTKDYGVSKEKAMVELRRMCDIAWEDMNREFLSLKDSVPMPLLTSIANLSRIMEVVYWQHQKGATNISNSKLLYDILFLQQVPL